MLAALTTHVAPRYRHLFCILYVECRRELELFLDMALRGIVGFK